MGYVQIFGFKNHMKHTNKFDNIGIIINKDDQLLV